VVLNVAFTHQGDLLASNSWDGTTRLWDPLAGKELVSTSGPFYGFNPSDERLAFSLGPKVGLWQVATGRECRSLYAYPEIGNGPWNADIHTNERLLASAHEDGARLWDRQSGREIALLPAGICQSALFHPKDGSVLTYGPEGLLRWPLELHSKGDILDVQPGPPQRLLEKTTSTGYALGLSPDGRRVALPMGNQCVVLELGAGNIVWRGTQRNINRAIFSPDGQWVASSTWLGKGVKVWNARTGECVQDLANTEQAGIAFSPDSRWLLTGTRVEYCFWSVGAWQPSKRIPQESGRLGYATFSGDGKLLAINPSRGLVRLIEPSTGRELATLPTDMPLSFSADGGLLVTRPANQVLQLWDLRAVRKQLAAMGLDWS
jgi:WD40 repeat protein